MSAVTKWQYWFKQGKDCIIFVGSRPGKRGKWLQYRQLPQQIRDYLCLVKSKRNWIADGIPTLTELDPQATNELKNEFEIDLSQSCKPVKKIPVLPCMSTSMDGAHCGLTDWYPTIEKGIQQALLRRKTPWTTGWYASKKEIASARITFDGTTLKCEASVLDDLDTEGHGEATIKKTTDLEKVRKAIDEAWDEATEEQKDNRVYTGFSIHNKKGTWVETLILPSVYDIVTDQPPGDSYHHWGWQKDGARIPAATRAQLMEWAEGCSSGGGQELTVGQWTIRPWKD